MTFLGLQKKKFELMHYMIIPRMWLLGGNWNDNLMSGRLSYEPKIFTGVLKRPVATMQ